LLMTLEEHIVQLDKTVCSPSNSHSHTIRQPFKGSSTHHKSPKDQYYDCRGCDSPTNCDPNITNNVQNIQITGFNFL
ncbi:hypothetical protein HMI55_005187, partial [Coelomomyces lativittatus]